MSGTRSGGAKAAETNMRLHGKDFYRKIGAIGGKKCCVKGFGSNPELAKIAGAIGGFKSRRGISQAYINRVKEAQKMHDEGATNREIAEHFSVSLGTVHNYLVRKV